MNLLFFADHCVPTSIIRGLQESQYTVFRLRDYLPTESPDEVVIAKAQELNSVLISLDGDFSDIVRYSPHQYKGILALQVKNRPESIPQIISRLKGYLEQHPDNSHYDGKLFLVESHRIRVRV